jgi:hypothetical protein
MRATTVSVIALTGILMLSGCGHRSSKSAARRAMTIPAVGDSAEFATESVVHAGSVAGPVAAKTEGGITYTVAEGVNRGRAVPAFITRTFELRGESLHQAGCLSTSRVVSGWLGIDSSGNTYLLGEAMDGANWEVVTDKNPPMCFPARIQPGCSWSYVAHFNTGNTESCTYRCVGTEDITTPSGPVHAWKASIDFSRTGVNGTDLHATGYLWFATDVPFVCETKTEQDITYQIAGMPVTTHFVKTLQAYHRSQ